MFEKNKGIFLTLLFLLIVLAVMGWYFFVQKKADKQIVKLDKQEVAASQDVTAEEVEALKETIKNTDWWLTTWQVAILEKTYDQQENMAIAKSLLQQYISQWDFIAAYQLVEKISKNKQDNQLTPDLVSFIAFNYSIVANNDSVKLELLKTSQKTMYELLYALHAGDFSSFEKKLEEASKNPNDKNNMLIAAFLQDRQTYRTLRDSPEYYYRGLLATTLMEAGYTPLVSKIANGILQENKEYILSYELLSQIAIKERKYAEAIPHLQTLMKIDSPHIARTSFFLGLSHYYMRDYGSAVSYLNQVRDPAYLYDAIRYLILIHNSQKEYKTMMSEFRYLLTEQKVEEHDYALFFDILFYQPYHAGGTGWDFSLAKEYAVSLVVPYIDSCNKQLASTAPYVCKYGETGRYLSQWRPEKALRDLLYLSKTYPQPIVFQALGDYYSYAEDIEKANYYYRKAFLEHASEE